jgi:hypothetical protein
MEGQTSQYLSEGKEAVMSKKRLLDMFLSALLMLAFSYFGGCSSQSKPTTDISLDNKSYSVTSTNGLRLTLSISSTTYKSGDTVFAFIDEWNTKTAGNNVTTASAKSSPISSLAYNLNPNGTGLYYYTYPIGISIWQGDYDLTELSPIRPLLLQDPSVIRYGPLIPKIASYDFKPSSDIATFRAENPNDLKPDSLRVTGTISAAGYWGTGLNSYRYFTPGTYTIVGGDEWGSLAILHFTVT